MRSAPFQPSPFILSVNLSLCDRLFDLAKRSRDPFSFLVEGDTVYFARHRPNLLNEPMSATVKLIQGIYEAQPQLARKIVRNRIFSTAPPTEMCLSMVKVAAKNMTWINPHQGSATPSQAPSKPLRWTEVHSPATPKVQPFFSFLNTVSDDNPIKDDRYWMSLARTLSETVAKANHPDPRPLFERNREIAALLVSREGKLLGSAVNTNSFNRTLHAEVNLLQNFHYQTKAALPAGSRIYSTLKPCKMCAGMIWHAADASQAFQLFYAKFDPGSNARSTILDTDSFERKRAAADPGNQRHVAQVHLPIT